MAYAETYPMPANTATEEGIRVASPPLGQRLEELEKTIAQTGEVVARLLELAETPPPGMKGETLNRGPEPAPTLADKHLKHVGQLQERLMEQRQMLCALAETVERLR